MRTPETHYFEGGYIEFETSKSQLYYKIWIYTENGNNISSIKMAKVENEEHLKQLQRIETLAQAIQDKEMA